MSRSCRSLLGRLGIGAVVVLSSSLPLSGQETYRPPRARLPLRPPLVISPQPSPPPVGFPQLAAVTTAPASAPAPAAPAAPAPDATVVAVDALPMIEAPAPSRAAPAPTAAGAAGVAGTGAAVPASGPTAAQIQGATGRIIGRVVDRETGRAMQGVQVLIVNTRIGSATDLDGRYEIARAPVGTVGVVARIIGYRPVRFDSIVVRAGQPTTVNFAMGSAPSVLAGVTVTAEAPRRSDSDVGLLAQQKNASTVSDGISAASIAKSPAGNAAEAVVRVPGIAVVEGKFVQVRGLAERYSGTTLNGTEIPSPEPSRRIVPLDIFPAKLLESIVATKTATPDKPGDFAGGLVEVTTKEFPDEFTAQVAFGQSGGNLTTGIRGHYPGLGGTDRFGFGVASRLLPAGIPGPGDTTGTERGASDRAMQELATTRQRGEWQPALRAAPPNASFEANAGGRFTVFGAPVGVVAATTYASEYRRFPVRRWTFRDGDLSSPPGAANVTQENTAVVDLSGLLNVSYRPVSWTKLAVKSVYTRNAEDYYARAELFNIERSNGNFTSYQRRYVMRDLLQLQGSGEHTLGWLRDSRLEWKYSWATARRDEPQNRALPYNRTEFGEGLAFNLIPTLQARFLNDIARTAQADWSVPFSVFLNDDGKFKTGVQLRTKTRTFTGRFYQYVSGTGVAQGEAPIAYTLPPDQLFQPEFLGATQALTLQYRTENALPYLGRDEILSQYAMLDLPVRRWLRLTGGARWEDWRLDLTFGPGTRGEEKLRTGRPDALGSLNVTAKLGPRTNLRLGYFDAVSRPDPRELSPDVYIAVAGECTAVGDPTIRRTRIRNADVRLEFYPELGELVSGSVFVKRFTDPIAEFISVAAISCAVAPSNLAGARNVGAELEWRRAIRPWLFGSVNATYVLSNVIDPSGRVTADPLAGQSPWVVNASVNLGRPDAVTQGSILVNYFSDRLVRFAGVISGGQGVEANIYERGRPSLDFRIQRRFGRGVSASLSGRNLLAPPVEFVQRTGALAGDIEANVFNQGPVFGLKVTYDIR